MSAQKMNQSRTDFGSPAKSLKLFTPSPEKKSKDLGAFLGQNDDLGGHNVCRNLFGSG